MTSLSGRDQISYAVWEIMIFYWEDGQVPTAMSLQRGCPCISTWASARNYGVGIQMQPHFLLQAFSLKLLF